MSASVLGAAGTEVAAQGGAVEAQPVAIHVVVADGYAMVRQALRALLDRDGDGSVADDLGQIGLGMLGKMMRGDRNG